MTPERQWKGDRDRSLKGRKIRRLKILLMIKIVPRNEVLCLRGDNSLFGSASLIIIVIRFRGDKSYD